METNTGIWLGLGVLGVLIIASLDTGVKTEPTTEPTDKPEEEPKKVIL
jgi:hypothetical protein